MKKNTEAVPGERLSKEAYLELMASELEDFNWDAILVYDRAKTNVIFRQEYIKRFSGKSWLPPVTFDGDSTATTIERVIDYRLDKPTSLRKQCLSLWAIKRNWTKSACRSW
ncbi:hypothetical protein [Pseudomonas sp. S1(2024)]|uniref:hypothetical protein n=1 Tax=Pseudomonas sp. S1(2024) TaxID=3390191 RepID=UPI00397959F4